MSVNQSNLNGNYFFGGTLACSTFAPPANCITNTAIIPNAGIDYTKSQQKHCVRYSQKAGTAVAAETVPIHIADGNGSLVNVQVVSLTPPTSSDTVTIDLKKGNVSTSFATVLSGVITLNSSSVTRTVYSGTISSALYSDGDTFELVIAVSGTSAQGLLVVVNFAELPA